MNRRALGILEYEKIIEMLTEEAGCDLSREMARSLTPLTDPVTIEEELRSTTEAVDLIVHKGPLPTGGLYDVEPLVSLARKGGCLTMRQLLQVHCDLVIAGRVSAFLQADVPELPLIMSLAELIMPHSRLEQEIDRCIVSEDEMSDSASPELRDIRRGILHQNEAIRTKLNRMVNSRSNQTYLQDAIVTIKDGRYVVPVKQEHRARFPGIIHDQSKGGATLFIEPQAIVEMNNELRELELAEQQEVDRILRSLSDQVAECHYDIINNQKLLGQLDYIMAKGKLSLRMQGEEPKLSQDGSLLLKGARHPLLDAKKVVPVNVCLGEEYRTLVVTGPNTGGKTVTLKTIGLLALMAQSGLHIPASSESRVPVYRQVFADIGDEQSIEQSLSTFSSHMKNIVHIVENAGEGSLVLLDELGAGTDPTEGAALAIAILEQLDRQGAQTAATTHYNELKKYALSTEGVQNASMEFDVETLSPTYRLIIGTPGRSNAFEISRKLGLSDELIQRAGLLIQRGDIEFEDVIGAIEEDKKQAEAQRDEAMRIAEEMREKQAWMEKEQEKFRRQKERLLAEAREEAREILRDAKDTAKEVRQELKELSRLESLGERNKAFDKSRRKLKDKEDRYAERVVKQVNTDPVSASQLKVGDSVKILSLDQNGELVSLPDSKGNVTVRIGVMKTTVPLEDLMIVVDGKKTKARKGSKTGYGSLYKAKTQTVKASINVQGENLDNARMDVGKYIDDAFIAGLREVSIIHGRGEGVLATGLRKALKKNKHVASVRAGKFNEGGDGVTVVKLKTE